MRIKYDVKQKSKNSWKKLYISPIDDDDDLFAAVVHNGNGLCVILFTRGR